MNSFRGRIASPVFWVNGAEDEGKWGRREIAIPSFAVVVAKLRRGGRGGKNNVGT